MKTFAIVCIIGLIVLAVLLSPATKATCYDDEALFSGSFWKGMFGVQPRLSDALDPCWWRGRSETFQSPANPRPTKSCQPGTHIDSGLCVPDGQHIVGGNRTCADGWHANEAEVGKCIRDGWHAVVGGGTCPDGWHGDAERCVQDGSHSVGNGRTCPDHTYLDGDNCVRFPPHAAEERHCDAGIPPEDCDLTPAQAKAKVDAWMASPAGREAVRVAREGTDAKEAKYLRL
jgi:hypothetical protein